MKPSIGRIVHFVGNGMMDPANHYPAMITHIWSDACVNLTVFPKGSPLDGANAGVKTSVTFNEIVGNPYTWHWPEREAGA